MWLAVATPRKPARRRTFESPLFTAPKKHCIEDGYKFQLEAQHTKRPEGWRRAPNDDWETVVEDRVCGEKLGTRRIDGAVCTVIRTDAGEVYAAMSRGVRAED